MTHRERFLATIERKPVDRPALWLGLPHPDAVPGLCRHFGVQTIEDVRNKVGDDLRTIPVPYQSGTGDAIYAALPFAKADPVGSEPDLRTLTAPGFFEGCDDPRRIEEFPWPDPTPCISVDACRAWARAVPVGHAVMGEAWSAHFQDLLSAFGMENALVMMHEAPAMVRAVADRITEFYLQANAIFYEAVADRIDAVLLGNDVGGQTALLVSRDMLRRFMMPGMKRLVDQAHDYGLKVVYHSCGAVREAVNDFIEVGIDALHPIQAHASNMDAESLGDEFGDRVAFVGGVDTQELLPKGTPEDVAGRVRGLCRCFPTGLVVSPSHEALLPDVPPANVEAMCRAAVNVGRQGDRR